MISEVGTPTSKRHVRSFQDDIAGRRGVDDNSRVAPRAAVVGRDDEPCARFVNRHKLILNKRSLPRRLGPIRTGKRLDESTKIQSSLARRREVWQRVWKHVGTRGPPGDERKLGNLNARWRTSLRFSGRHQNENQDQVQNCYSGHDNTPTQPHNFARSVAHASTIQSSTRFVC